MAIIARINGNFAFFDSFYGDKINKHHPPDSQFENNYIFRVNESAPSATLSEVHIDAFLSSVTQKNRNDLIILFSITYFFCYELFHCLAISKYIFQLFILWSCYKLLIFILSQMAHRIIMRLCKTVYTFTFMQLLFKYFPTLRI